MVPVKILFVLSLIALGLTSFYFFSTEKWRPYHSGIVQSAVDDRSIPVDVELTTVSKSTLGRLGVVCYIPNGIHQVYHFLVMLYGSWRYINDHKEHFFDKLAIQNTYDIDLLAFCHPSVCSEIRNLCKSIKNLEDITTSEIAMCWAIEQSFEAGINYGPINSYIMFNRTDIDSLQGRYKYLLRTDFDVFLTPAMFTMVPKTKFLFGQGGYSETFNMKRLKKISKKLGLKHRGVHHIGSTCFGETSFFIKAGKLTFKTTRYLWLNEFDPKLPGLETIDFKKNIEGEWIRWWRPVASMYGGEIALNHLIPDISVKYKGPFDGSSCSKDSIWKTPHIHCWHNDCEFQKFRFMNYLNIAINSKETLPAKIVHKIIEMTYPHDIHKMTLSEYSTFIAWNSVSKYLRKWFV